MKYILVFEVPGTPPLAGRLHRAGLVATASTASEVLERCALGGVDLVVMRHVPGRLDAQDLVKHLRRLAPATETLIVLGPGEDGAPLPGAQSTEGLFFAQEPLLSEQLVRACSRTLRLAPRYRRLLSGQLGLPCGAIRIAPFTLPQRRAVN